MGDIAVICFTTAIFLLIMGILTFIGVSSSTTKKLGLQLKRGSRTLGCLKNAKSLKSQAPQGFSGCLDIENDEMNKKKFLSASPRVNQTLRSL